MDIQIADPGNGKNKKENKKNYCSRHPVSRFNINSSDIIDAKRFIQESKN